MQKRPDGWQTALDDANHAGELLVTIAGTAYTAQDIVSCEVERNLLDKTAEIGNAVAAVLTLRVKTKVAVPRQAEIVLQYRLRLDDARTEYIPKGTYWVNTRETDGRYIKLTCYDAMLKAEQDYLANTAAGSWPRTEADCAAEIARRIGAELDGRTVIAAGAAHMVDTPTDKTMRDVLKHIAVTNGGNWCITEAGRLRLVPLTGTGDNLGTVDALPDTEAPLQFTGVRLARGGDDAPYTAGDMTGCVLEATLPDGMQANADELWKKLREAVYLPYRCEQRHMDPLAENGDTLTLGGRRCVLYNIRQDIGPAFFADLEAPGGGGELEQEYPYLTAAERTKKQVENLKTDVDDLAKSTDKGFEEVSSRIEQTKSSIVLEVSKNYATKSELTMTQNSIVLEVSENYATKDSLSGYTKTGEVRSRFAMDPTNITIESGRVAFKAGTITINSGNFTLTEKGEVTASGTFSTDNGSGRCIMTNGELTLQRRLSGGNMVDGVFLSAWGPTDSVGRIVVYGPTGNDVYAGVTVAGYYSGGAIAINNASGQTKIQMGIDGNGDGYIVVNGNWYT